MIRLVQDARKSDGLDVTDRIALRWSARDPDLAAALAEHAAADRRGSAGGRLRVPPPSSASAAQGFRTPMRNWTWSSGSAAPEV